MQIEVRYSWRTKWGGRTVTSAIKMTEEQARKAHPDAVRIDNTREEVLVCNQPCEVDLNTAAMIGQSRVYLSQLHRPKAIPQEPEFVRLPMPAHLYQAKQDGDVWTVSCHATEPPHVVYCGAGPATVEAAP